MILLMLCFAVLGGVALAVQASINGKLGTQVGVFAGTFLNFGLGTIVTGLLVLFFEPKYSLTLLDVPKWQLTGAFPGIVYIAVMVLVVAKLGTAVATVAVIFGQLAMSLLIDTFGWFHNPAIAFSLPRLLAVICLGFALYFIYAGNRKQ
ncbi:DMT family transporter [Testudinibacter sp. P80/BLE/0925]|uniref:DMT family transporter n=1 Tax=Testudinibacter sp. TW-1 TaxID=3417757 RepID=UPI003D36DD31